MDPKHAAGNFNLAAPDLFYFGTNKDDTAAITRATHVGTANIEGFVCDHYAFRQKDVDWELWIEQGGRPLPRKMVITRKNERGAPEYVAELSGWNLSPSVPDEAFTFKAPAGAKAVDMATQKDPRVKGVPSTKGAL